MSHRQPEKSITKVCQGILVNELNVAQAVQCTKMGRLHFIWVTWYLNWRIHTWRKEKVESKRTKPEKVRRSERDGITGAVSGCWLTLGQNNWLPDTCCLHLWLLIKDSFRVFRSRLKGRLKPVDIHKLCMLLIQSLFLERSSGKLLRCHLHCLNVS